MKMTPRPFLPLLTLLALASAPASVAAQSAPPEEPSPERLEKIETLKKAVKNRKFERDREAIGIIDDLLSQRESCHEKTIRKFVGALSDVFKSKKRKPDNTSIYIAASAALGELGTPDAAKVLAKAFANKAFSKRRDWASLQDAFLEALGKTKDKKQLTLLIDEATQSHHDGVKVAAGRALRHYANSDYKIRRSIVKEMIQDFDRVANGASSNLNQDPQVERFKRTLRAISDPWNETLASLTGEKIRTGTQWRSWWNDYKNSPKKWKHQTES